MSLSKFMQIKLVLYKFDRIGEPLNTLKRVKDNTEERPEVKNLLESVETGCRTLVDEISEGIVRTVGKLTEVAEMTTRLVKKLSSNKIAWICSSLCKRYSAN